MWQRWQVAKIADADSAEGLDIMLEMAAHHQLSLTAVWHAVKDWQHSETSGPVKKQA
ncbi:STY4526/YPO1902 family pathogenicity island replication protein [Xenorhabdus bovienii]|uniref:STY4526/YPO1902 family pathogenicity island replication protein n=1 Tax=Xenorhabdus bovienii TaxID=40576 RepID=UPI0023B22B77|nr:STY4526/YPO1902 family pathogenicity island replication protein [Xenorhabdus bovienii]